MKKLKILAMIPAIILCACNADQTGCQCSNAYDIEIKGEVKKVTLAEAEDQIKEIKGHNALNEYTDIEIVHIMNSGKGEKKQTIKMKFALNATPLLGKHISVKKVSFLMVNQVIDIAKDILWMMVKV